jgi:hypothetical protein
MSLTSWQCNQFFSRLQHSPELAREYNGSGSAGVLPAVFGVSPNTFNIAAQSPIIPIDAAAREVRRETHRTATETVALPRIETAPSTLLRLKLRRSLFFISTKKSKFSALR